MDMHQVDVMRARIYFLETALAAMTAERDSLKDAVHFLNTMNDEQDEWFTRIADDHGGWHEDLPTGEAHIEEIIGNLKKERDARDVAIGVLGQAIANVKSTTDWPELTNTMQAGLFCGVEDRDLRDRYDGARYGYEDALERCEEFIRNAVSAVDANPIARAAVEGER